MNDPITVKTKRPHLYVIEPLAGHRLHRVSPDLRNVHRRAS